MASLKIILLCILAAVTYGILHDQVTARVCIEYFTVGHKPIFATESPTLIAFGWGILATWWVGLILGVVAALISRAGSWPKLEASNLIRPIASLLIVMAVASLLAGISGYQLAKDNQMVLPDPLGDRVPKDHHWGFFADTLAHLAAYTVGALGGVILCIGAIVERRRMARREREANAPLTQPTEPGLLILCRWTARTISVPLFGLVVVLLLGDGVPTPLTATTRENLLSITVLTLLVSSILSLKKRRPRRHPDPCLVGPVRDRRSRPLAKHRHRPLANARPPVLGMLVDATKAR